MRNFISVSSLTKCSEHAEESEKKPPQLILEKTPSDEEAPIKEPSGKEPPIKEPPVKGDALERTLMDYVLIWSLDD